MFKAMLEMLKEEAGAMLPKWEASAIDFVSGIVPPHAEDSGDGDLEGGGLAFTAEQLSAQLEAHLSKVLEGGLRGAISRFVALKCGPVIGGLGKAASKRLEATERLETWFVKKLEDEKDCAEAKLFKFLGGKGSIKSRVVKSVLGAATKYEVSAGGFQGSFDMLLLALRRSPIQARTPVSLHPHAPPNHTYLRSAAQRRRQRADLPARQDREARGASQEM